MEKERTGHSPWGFSGLYRYRRCPKAASYAAHGLDNDSEYSAQGTAAHELGEMTLRIPGVSVLDVKEDWFPDRKYEPDEIAAVRTYVRFVRQLVASEPDAELFVEVSFELTVPEIPQADGNVWGKIDAAVWLPIAKHLHVIDYKHGIGVDVTAEFNDQGTGYALGCMQALGLPAEKVSIHIVQPRSKEAEEPVKSWETTPEHVLNHRSVIVEAIRASLETPDLAVPGKHCHFCKGDGICPERANAALGDLVEVAEIQPNEVFGLPEPNRLDDHQIATIFLNSDAIRQFLKAVEGQAYSRKMVGQLQDVGVKFIRQQARREWKPGYRDADILAELLELGIPRDRIVTEVYPSPAQADELIAEFIEDPALAKEAKTDIAVRLVKKESTGLRLVPSDHRGKEVIPAVDNIEGLALIAPPPSD